MVCSAVFLILKYPSYWLVRKFVQTTGLIKHLLSARHSSYHQEYGSREDPASALLILEEHWTLNQGNFWGCIRMGQVVCRAILTNWFTLRSTEPSTVLGNTVKLFRLEHYLFLLLLDFCLISLHELLKKCKLFCFLSIDLPQNFRFTPHCVVHNYILLLKEKRQLKNISKIIFTHDYHTILQCIMCKIPFKNHLQKEAQHSMCWGF